MIVNNARPPRPGFTLVEMLMVVAIIAILVGLGTAAYLAARGRGVEVQILSELNQLEQGVVDYQNDHGDFPPNPATYEGGNPQIPGEQETTREARIMTHLKRAFPRYRGSYSNFQADVAQATMDGGFPQPGLNVDHLDSAEVLVFFLGGLPNTTTETLQTGFAADPSQPFQAVSKASARTKLYVEFDARRLVDRDGDGWREYIPPINAGTQTPPYVYFDHRTYGLSPHYPYVAARTSNPSRVVNAQAMAQLVREWGIAEPYLERAASGTALPFVNPKKFQIVSCGRDGKYGGNYENYQQPSDFAPRAAVTSTTENFTLGDNDNLTNFATRTLESAKQP